MLTFCLDVGTKLYIAPEVQSARNVSRNYAKADMYSLGVRILYSSLYTFLLMASLDRILRDELHVFDKV